MNDSEIIDLFYMRSEQAIIELSVKYGNVCNKVAKNILNNILDAEECVNDAYLGAWNTIPPQNPNPLLTYICRIVRNLSIKKYHANTSVCGMAFNIVADPLVGYFYKTYLLGVPQDISKALAKIATGVTAFNAVWAVVLATVLYLALRPALKKAGLFHEM